MSNISRRQIVKFGSATFAATLIPAGRLVGEAAAEPHFYLQVLFEPGWDPTYLFDARPLAMTEAGKLQNYLGQEPEVWTGANGRATYASPLVAPLKPYFSQFSILNGVLMAAVDGHEQNKNFLLTGNPFGGESLLPHLNSVGEPASLDYVQIGNTFGLVLSNASGGITLDADTAVSLSGEGVGLGNSVDPSQAFIEGRIDANGANDPESGLFAKGVNMMRRGMLERLSLSKKLQQVAIDQSGSDVSKTMSLAHQYFRNGISKSAFIVIGRHDLDVHDAGSAMDQPTTYADVVADLEEILRFLTETPLNGEDGPRLIDCTTVVITSEFGRTMRQSGQPIDNTGTDHNPLCNTVIIGGKGIEGGLVLGESDRRTPDEVVSPAHLDKDNSEVRLMGKPFDFTTSDTVANLDASTYAEFKLEDYLTYASIANTIYGLFGVDDSRHWLLRRNGAAAAMVKGILKV